MNALYKAVLVAVVLSALGFIPVTMAFDTGEFTFGELYGCTLIGLGVTFLLVAITEFYTGTRWNPVKGISRASTTGHATNIIEGLAIGMQATALPGDRDRRRDRRRELSSPASTAIGVAVMAQLAMTGLIVALDAYGPGDGQRRRDRRDGRPAGRGARRHRSARRGRQHDEGRHEGLRDRLGRARGPHPLRRLHLGARRGGAAASRST